MSLDAGTFDAFYDAHAASVYASALRIVHDPGLAEDIVQETFVKAYTADGEIEHPAAWLGTVARRAAIDEVRRRGRLTGLAEDADDDAPAGAELVDEATWSDPAKATTSADSVARARDVLDGLRPDDRTLLVLRYGEGLEPAAIAGLLGKTVNATTVALHRARGRADAHYVDGVLSRPGLAPECLAFREQTLARTRGAPVTDAYLTHVTACAWCQESEACLLYTSPSPRD